MRRVPALAAAAVLVLSACGGGADGVSDKATAELEHHITQVRTSAAASDPARLLANLTEMRTAVATLKAQGELSEAGAAAILKEADAVQQQSALITPPTTVRPAPAFVADNDDGPQDRGRGKNKKDDGEGHRDGEDD